MIPGEGGHPLGGCGEVLEDPLSEGSSEKIRPGHPGGQGKAGRGGGRGIALGPTGGQAPNGVPLPWDCGNLREQGKALGGIVFAKDKEEGAGIVGGLQEGVGHERAEGSSGIALCLGGDVGKLLPPRELFRQSGKRLRCRSGEAGTGPGLKSVRRGLRHGNPGVQQVMMPPAEPIQTRPDQEKGGATLGEGGQHGEICPYFREGSRKICNQSGRTGTDPSRHKSLEAPRGWGSW